MPKNAHSLARAREGDGARRARARLRERFLRRAARDLSCTSSLVHVRCTAIVRACMVHVYVVLAACKCIMCARNQPHTGVRRMHAMRTRARSERCVVVVSVFMCKCVCVSVFVYARKCAQCAQSAYTIHIIFVFVCVCANAGMHQRVMLFLVHARGHSGKRCLLRFGCMLRMLCARVRSSFICTFRARAHIHTHTHTGALLFERGDASVCASACVQFASARVSRRGP